MVLPFPEIFSKGAFSQFWATFRITFSVALIFFFSVFSYMFIAFRIYILIISFVLSVSFIALFLMLSKLLLIQFAITLVSDLPLFLFVSVLSLLWLMNCSSFFLSWSEGLMAIQLQIIKFPNSLLCRMNTRIDIKSMLKKSTCAFELTNSRILFLKTRLRLL